MEKIWRDFHLRRIVYFVLSISSISLIAYFNLSRENTKSEIISSTLIFLFFILVFINLSVTKLTYVAKEGIRVGNALNDSYENFKLNKLTAFIQWKDIKSINLVRREVHRPLHNVLRYFIIVTDKQNKKYESFIANPKDFVKTIKELKKEKLISKDSKYLN